MLKHRIITTLMFDETYQIVKPVRFERPYRRLGTIPQFLNVVERRNVDELILLDITATEQTRSPDWGHIRELVSNVFAPITFGGGIHSVADVANALTNGADKVAIKSSYEISYDVARRFGSQALVAVIDWRADFARGNKYDSAVKLARYLSEQGAGEILLTDIDRDGMMNGYNTQLIYTISQQVKIPVIASGGCGEPLHMVEAIEAGADAVAAGSMFLYTDVTNKDAAGVLNEHGIGVRIDETN